jgi:hypothetical protein
MLKKKCKCKPQDRRLTFITLNGNNTYVCKSCGRMHGSREPIRRIRNPTRMQIGVGALAAAAWLVLIIIGRW